MRHKSATRSFNTHITSKLQHYTLDNNDITLEFQYPYNERVATAKSINQCHFNLFQYPYNEQVATGNTKIKHQLYVCFNTHITSELQLKGGKIMSITTSFQYPYNERVATEKRIAELASDKFQYPYNEQVATEEWELPR